MINLKKYLIKGKQLSSSPSFHILFSSAIIAIIFLFADYIFTRTFTKKDFGTWRQIVLIVSMGATLLSLGFPEGFRYFISLENKKISTHLIKILCSTLITSLIIYILILLGIDELLITYFKNIDLRFVIRYFPILFIVVTLSRAYRYLMIQGGASWKLFKYSIISFTISTSLIIITYYFYSRMNEEILWTWISFLLFILYLSLFILYFFEEKKLNYSNIIFKDVLKFREYFKIGFPLYIATFIGVLSLNLDKLIVNKYSDLTTFAIYSIGAIELPIVGMIGTAISQSIFPKLVESYKKNISHTKEIWLQATLKATHITYPIILILMLFSKAIILILFTDKYLDAVPIFQTYLLLGLWRNTQYGSLIIASGNTKWTMIYSTAALILNIILSVLFFRLFGILGVAWGAFLAAMIVAIFQLLHEGIFILWLKRIFLNKLIFIEVILIFMVYFYFLFGGTSW